MRAGEVGGGACRAALHAPASLYEDAASRRGPRGQATVPTMLRCFSRQAFRVTLPSRRGLFSLCRCGTQGGRIAYPRSSRGQTIVSSASRDQESRRLAGVLRLIPSDGTIRFEAAIEKRRPEAGALAAARASDPCFGSLGSLSPRLTVGQIVTEGLLVHEPETVARRSGPARGPGAPRSATRPPRRATAIRTSSRRVNGSESPSPAQ